MKEVREGFTLVELSLSMVFVGVLSLAVLFVINNAVVSYRRSNTLGQVNSIGMDIVDDMRSATQGSSAKTLTTTCAIVFAGNSDAREKCESDNAYNFVSITKNEDIVVNGELIKEVPIYGAFCTGLYSYIWNSGYYWASDDDVDFASKGEKAELKYTKDESKKDFRLLKVKDSSKAVCAAAVYEDFSGTASSYDSAPSEILNVIDVSKVIGNLEDDDIVDLISSNGADNLALYDLAVANPAMSKENNSVFYSVSFILGTVSGGMNIKSSGSACKAPNDYDSNFDYCAINKFSFAIRATGE